MPEGVPILLPMENVNDENVTFVAWLVKEGEEVHEGQALAEVETTKALFELSAPASGRLWQKARAGEEVRVGAVVGYIGGDGSAPETKPRVSRMADPASATARFSKKAWNLLQKHGLDPALFEGQGMVREQDILERLARAPAAGQDLSGLHFALKGLPLNNVTLPAGFRDTGKGRLDPQFLEHLRANLESFGKLSSAEKCDAYRQHGAIIGAGSSLGQGTAIVAPQIVIGEEVRIGENGDIQCRERFQAGSLSSFRSGLNVRGGTIVLGENIFGGSHIRVGGGGNADPWALLVVGDTTYLGDDLFINICRPVIIGKEVFLTQRSILVTHNIGHSMLEGYENRFAPIVLEDYSQVGMNCTIYAGSTIGRGAIVGSNSYVISTIPAGKLAMGVPARVVRDAARPPDRERQTKIVQAMVRDYHELLGLKGHQVSALETDPIHRFTVTCQGSRFLLCFAEQYPAPGVALEAADESIVWTLAADVSDLPPGRTVMDLLAKVVHGPSGIFADSTREFLRKRGIRCQPGPWRYRRGLI